MTLLYTIIALLHRSGNGLAPFVLVRPTRGNCTDTLKH